MDQDVKQFYEDHAAGGAGNVVVAHVQFDEGERIGIFSSIENAQVWADTFEDNGACNGVVFVPYVVDVPEYGNVPARGQQ
jgi:hypothetical protein